MRFRPDNEGEDNEGEELLSDICFASFLKEKQKDSTGNPRLT